MNVRMVALILAALTLGGCGSHSLSGTYTASDAHAAVMLQLTEDADHRLMGTLSAVQLTPPGDTTRVDFSITDGSVDGRSKSIALTLKSNAMFGQTRNVSGEVTSSGINLAMPEGLLRLSSGTMEGFEQSSHALEVAGADRKRDLAQERRAADALKRVAELTQALSSYNGRIAANTRGPDDVRKEEEGLVATARQALAAKRRLAAANREFDSSQAGFRVGQLAFQLNLLRLQVEQDVQMGHEHIQDLDRQVANNPCTTQASIPGCVALSGELARYQSTRSRVRAELGQLAQDLATNLPAMGAINKAAGN
ncbi:hypothetical protein RHOFW510R12_00900 [Rhodanobacter sp. FW510-R12]|uniref:hypothetical protein n=1 Tax=Rhodanobacter thiooxydans TaxID=416169 RepID=UPI000921FB96|nr:hypothetical protein [Rhodanobacter thiooxydans]UJJ56799.1 hypothetical protein LRK53_18460 [Rhodanobacter thiooxydans]